MRMLATARIPVETGNEALKNGTLPKIMESILDTMKPEAAYFTPDQGERTAFLFFDMQESSQMPILLEHFFLELNAKVTIQPVMNSDELRKGLGELMGGR
ncbi:hypothetical protein AB0D04_21955 [Streptomyces sp. NPDC048483]|uniref:hypothetical protein n=1 Tax=Streptomyces sp. NPDC048483 TaxID=3154927 RepID=UPI00343DAA09